MRPIWRVEAGSGADRGMKSQVNRVQVVRLEGLTRVARASRVKDIHNERKKDSDRTAVEEE